MIAVLDYGMGNFGSIMNMLARIGAEAILTADAAEIARADKLVLPGVGAFDKGMERLRALDLIPVLNDRVLGQRTPILGICLGMQLFARGSEEGDSEGLAWIDGCGLRFRFDGANAGLTIPHMGWNTLQLRKSHPVFADMEADARFYFVHSYYIQCRDENDVLAQTNYGIDFTSVVTRGPIIGTQFHPEKSLRWGMQIFRRFVQYG